MDMLRESYTAVAGDKIGGGQWCRFHALVAHGRRRKGPGACNSNRSLPPRCLELGATRSGLVLSSGVHLRRLRRYTTRLL